MLVSSIYTVEICPKSAEGGEKILGLGATHLRSVDGFGRFGRKNGGSVDVLGGLGLKCRCRGQGHLRMCRCRVPEGIYKIRALGEGK